ncbi:hypothetical protein ACLOJK_027023 [Asimina triloba]
MSVDLGLGADTGDYFYWPVNAKRAGRELPWIADVAGCSPVADRLLDEKGSRHSTPLLLATGRTLLDLAGKRGERLLLGSTMGKKKEMPDHTGMGGEDAAQST